MREPEAHEVAADGAELRARVEAIRGQVSDRTMRGFVFGAMGGLVLGLIVAVLWGLPLVMAVLVVLFAVAGTAAVGGFVAADARRTPREVDEAAEGPPYMQLRAEAAQEALTQTIGNDSRNPR